MDKLIVFDLDDTLYNEIDFLESAFKSISLLINKSNSSEIFKWMLFEFHNKEDVFQKCEEKYNIGKQELLNLYRNYLPNFLSTSIDLTMFFRQINDLGHKIGLITDGRSITQRNKLKALKIANLFDKIIISEEFGSEKPCITNFTAFDEFGDFEKYYIGDNLKKDFIAPNHLGWTSICLLDNGKNIHKQNFDCDEIYLPKIKINSLYEIFEIIYD